MIFDRREIFGVAGGAVALAAGLRPAIADSVSGSALYGDVVRYSALGDHRTASAGDNATTAWYKSRFEALGFAVETPGFAFPLFVPERCELRDSQNKSTLFPAWPVVPTPNEGLRGTLAAGGSGVSKDAIAVVSIQNAQIGGFAAEGIGSTVAREIADGARAVVAITEGPSGQIIAQNADLKQFAWTVPVLLAAGRDKEWLLAAANRRDTVDLLSVGREDPKAIASNVVARRAGRGKTIVVSTPKSGWFRCAGERGTGAAIFLALAARLAATDADILFLSASGHEIDGLGGKKFLENGAPSPDTVKLWVHLGANVACEQLENDHGVYRKLGRPTDGRRLVVSTELLAAASSAFAGQEGYDQPREVTDGGVGPEIAVYSKAGYQPILGMLGGGLLHHTPADLPDAVTSPAVLEPVARAVDSIVLSIAKAV